MVSMIRPQRPSGASLEVIATVFGNVVARMDRDEALKAAISEAERERDRLTSENLYLRREFHERVLSFGSIPVPLIARAWS